jgi:hypothetical protein
MTAIVVYPVLEDSLLVHHSFSGPLRIGGVSWELDNFTVQLLTEGIITTNPARAYTGAPAPGGGSPAPRPNVFGTAASLDFGTAAGDLVRLDGSAKLPAVDGSRLTGISSGGGRTILTADTAFYVATTGNDSTGNGTSGAPWATPQYANDIICAQYDLNGFDCTVQIGNGRYAGFSMGPGFSSKSNPNGWNKFWFGGSPLISALIFRCHPTDPTKVVFTEGAQYPGSVISANLDPLVSIAIFGNYTVDASALSQDSGGPFVFNGVGNAFVGDANWGGPPYFISAATGSVTVIGPTSSGTGGDVFLVNYPGVNLEVIDPITVSGRFDFFANCKGALIQIESLITLVSTPSFAAFCNIRPGTQGIPGVIYWQPVVDVLTVGSATGKKFDVDGIGSVLDVHQTPGANQSTLPGDSAGTLSHGGAYIDAGGLSFAAPRNTDPHIVGAIWNNAGTLTISAG